MHDFSSVLECVLHWPCSVLLETQNCFQDLLENLTPMIVDTVGSLEQLLPKNFLAQKNPSTFLLWTEGLLFDNSKLRFFCKLRTQVVAILKNKLIKRFKGSN